MEGKTYVTSFGSSQKVEKFTRTSSGMMEYGYSPDGRPVPDEFLIRVSSIRNQATIVAPMQESIGFEVVSQWGPACPKSLFGLWNNVVQALSIGEMSFVTKAMSRRIWIGSSPIRIGLKLRFESVEDPVREVVEPVRILQCMALPSEAQKGEKAGDFWGGVQQVVPFLAPPGPTPFTPEGLLNLKVLNPLVTYLEESKSGDKIMVEVGKFLTFPNVILHKVSCSVPAAFTTEGDPIRAEVAIAFETYEMMTSQDLSNAFSKSSGESKSE